MKEKIQRHFSLTDKGTTNIFKAARVSFCKYLTFMLPPMLVFTFLRDFTNNQLNSFYFYLGVLGGQSPRYDFNSKPQVSYLRFFICQRSSEIVIVRFQTTFCVHYTMFV